MNVVIATVHGILVLGMILSLVRLWRGPHISDRVVAFDLFAALVLGHLIVFFARTGKTLFLEIGIVIALLTFLATVALARLIEERATGTEEDA